MYRQADENEELEIKGNINTQTESRSINRWNGFFVKIRFSILPFYISHLVLFPNQVEQLSS
jgi:hypothetical protein